MFRNFLLSIIALGFMASATAASEFPENLESVTVNGVEVLLYRHGESLSRRYLILVGDKVALKFESFLAKFQGVYEGDRHTYLLIEKPAGGSGCISNFEVLDLTNMQAPRASGNLGECNILMKDKLPVVVDGKLVVELRSYNLSDVEKYIFGDSGITMTTSRFADQLIGPERAPGGDVAAYLLGKPLSDMSRTRFIRTKLQAIMPSEVFQAFAQTSVYTMGSPTFDLKYGYAIAGGCKAKACEEESSAIAADHKGSIWAYVKMAGKGRFFGNPPPMVQDLMLKAAH